MKETIELNWTKTCKHSVRYDADPVIKKPPVTSIYVMNVCFDDPTNLPQKIKVTVEY